MAKKTQGWSRASAQFQKALLSSSAGINRTAQQIFINSNERFLDFVQSNKNHLPYYTGNLHDSIATAVSQSGRIIKAAYMPKEATRKQHTANRKRIDGLEEAVVAIRRQSYPGRGVYNTLVVAVPYAEGANETSHEAGYLNWLENGFVSYNIMSMKLLELTKTRPGIKFVLPPITRFD